MNINNYNIDKSRPIDNLIFDSGIDENINTKEDENKLFISNNLNMIKTNSLKKIIR